MQTTRPARSIPLTTWAATGSRWVPTPRSGVMLLIGLVILSFGEVFLVVADLGNTPWTTLAQGISERFDVTIGTATFLIGAVVLLGWIALRERPGIGTIVNVIVTAVAIDVALQIVPEPDHLLARWLMVLAGTACVGLGAVLYLTCKLGSGPRDGLMTGLHARTGWPVPRIRLAIEITVLMVGWIFGGTIGLATLTYALLVPRVIGIALALVSRHFARPILPSE